MRLLSEIKPIENWSPLVFRQIGIKEGNTTLSANIELFIQIIVEYATILGKACGEGATESIVRNC